ncbi:MULTISPECIES: SDR family oxidoreductase [Thermoactinomyces]|uniref:SDR family NAD(P)-dependent oxidoreductase n=1 Tax=Thermoactinomyces daqus TaxID=1329516 RepID=A0A7W2AIC1_9BACL|nr:MULTISPECIES: SDR family NAD(P)-dependent oxidoreductase [Thermoactinomyces]MBA4543105.1 SDR family NAD(P)-dependent oxidoreductase [Thermoactinomyces daqus]MBH8596660.1 SDR family NAD(P)-dependent oxidoreductase [Thermoactinomyces sp. CICC 10523]MBH8603422.1 SDR family NAD(P)-dependent oxidoreductase [Thermoactinomyces sp. CICC 10522]MBH8607811.1 SDR family NAD(P)-dependent oxidoreductase [Thermoactinomyces sp. CICC 10521]
MSSLSGKVAIVTGASKGLGRAIATRLARGGALVVAAARSKEKLEQLQQEESQKIVSFPCDVTRATEVKALIDFTRERFGRLDILVNNAGIGRFGKVEDLSEDDWDQMMAVNLKGAFLACKYAIPHLKETEGHIVNISSIAGTESFAGGAGYCASKFGLMALSDALTLELKPHQVKVSTVCPGSIKTEFGRHKDYALEAEQVAETVWTIVSAPKGVIINQVRMRPLVPREYQK